MIIVGEQRLRNVIEECIEHYHLKRNHQGLDNRLITPGPGNSGRADGPVRYRQRFLPGSQAVDVVASITGRGRNEIYRQMLALRSGADDEL